MPAEAPSDGPDRPGAGRAASGPGTAGTPRFRALLGTVTIDGHPLPAGMQRQVQRWWGNPELPPAWLITVWRQRRRAMHSAYPARWRRG